MRASAVAAVVLAAGRGERMGANKMLVSFEGRPLLVHALAPLLELGLGDIIVVTGFEASLVEAILPPEVRAVRCLDHQQGMGASLATGAAACRPGDSILVVLGDMPRVPPEHYRALLAQSGEIVATKAPGFVGPPVLFAPTLRAELEGLAGDRGARAVLERHSDSVRTVEAEVRWIDDVDSPPHLLRGD